VVDIVQQETSTVGGTPFYGLFNHTLPRRCWAEDSSRLLLSTPQLCNIKTYVINIGMCYIVSFYNRVTTRG
jgi:hypothetical protein